MPNPMTEALSKRGSPEVETPEQNDAEDQALQNILSKLDQILNILTADKKDEPLRVVTQSSPYPS